MALLCLLIASRLATALATDAATDASAVIVETRPGGERSTSQHPTTASSGQPELGQAQQQVPAPYAAADPGAAPVEAASYSQGPPVLEQPQTLAIAHSEIGQRQTDLPFLEEVQAERAAGGETEGGGGGGGEGASEGGGEVGGRADGGASLPSDAPPSDDVSASLAGGGGKGGGAVRRNRQPPNATGRSRGAKARGRGGGGAGGGGGGGGGGGRGRDGSGVRQQQVRQGSGKGSSAVLWREEGERVGEPLAGRGLLLWSWLLSPCAALLLYCCLPYTVSRRLFARGRPPGLLRKRSSTENEPTGEPLVSDAKWRGGLGAAPQGSLAPSAAPTGSRSRAGGSREGGKEGGREGGRDGVGGDAPGSPLSDSAAPPWLPTVQLLCPSVWLLWRQLPPSWRETLRAPSSDGRSSHASRGTCSRGSRCPEGCACPWCRNSNYTSDASESSDGLLHQPLGARWPLRVRVVSDEDEPLAPSVMSRWRRIGAARGGSRGARQLLPLSQLPPLHATDGQACLLSEAQRARLIAQLPPSISLSAWELLHSTERDGCSLALAYRKLEKAGPTVLLVLDAAGGVFGGFASSSWHVSSHYFGTGESFLFAARPEWAVYPWSAANSHFLLGSPDSIGFGGGGSFGLWLDESFEFGSSGRCDTFANEPLAASRDFRVIACQFWGFNAMHESPHLPHESSPTSPMHAIGEPPRTSRHLSWSGDGSSASRRLMQRT